MVVFPPTFPLQLVLSLLLQHRGLDGVRALRAPTLVLGFSLKNGSSCFVPRHPRKLAKNLFGRGFNVFEQQCSCGVIQRLVAELAGLSVILALSAWQINRNVRKCSKYNQPPVSLTCMEELAGEPFVEVEALVSLGASVVEIELAELPDLGRLGVVGEHAVLAALLAFPLHEQAADLALLGPPLAPSLLPPVSVLALSLPLVSISHLGRRSRR